MATSERGIGASPANVTKHLKGVDFPARKQDLLKHAKQLKAEQVVIDEIQKMEEREYQSMADIVKSFTPESRSVSQKGQQVGQGKPQVKAQAKQSHHR
jgi:hypothetical protein